MAAASAIKSNSIKKEEENAAVTTVVDELTIIKIYHLRGRRLC
jgi:hypothetical protein